MNARFKQKYGPWAIIAGASSGIGREFAVQIAHSGLNIVLVARRTSELEALATQIAEESSVLTRVIAIDLAARDSVSRLSTWTSGSWWPLRIRIMGAIGKGKVA